jgi:hypothetical protein
MHGKKWHSEDVDGSGDKKGPVMYEIVAQNFPIILHSEGKTWGYHSPLFGGGAAGSRRAAISLARELLNEGVRLSPKKKWDLQAPEIVPKGSEVIWLSIQTNQKDGLMKIPYAQEWWDRLSKSEQKRRKTELAHELEMRGMDVPDSDQGWADAAYEAEYA